MDVGGPLALFALGAVVGTYGTLIGAGGGFLIVPVLMIVLGYTHDRAVGTSLVVVTANAVSGSIAYLRKKRVDLRTAWPFALATLPGAVLGARVVDALSGRAFTTAFGVLLVVVAVWMVLRPPPHSAAHDVEPPRPAGIRGWGFVVRRIVESDGTAHVYGFSMPLGLALSFVVGFLSSILGIGGGIVHVPALVALFDFPAHVAAATSHFILAISAATGAASHAALGHVDVVAAGCMAAGAVVGAQIGGALSSRVKSRFILRALGGALGLVGLRLLWGAWLR
jgi:uncharacterized membrane protein YfcA